MVRDGERVHVQPAQIGVELGQRVRVAERAVLVAVDDVVVAPAAVALPLVAGEGDEMAGAVGRGGGGLHLGPLADERLVGFRVLQVHAAVASVRADRVLVQVPAGRDLAAGCSTSAARS